MADIELVIKIPEDKLKLIKKHGLEDNFILCDVATKAIKKGIPLPKGHGKLIAEPTEGDIAKTVGGQNDFAECIRDAVKLVFDNASTLVDADKESRE